MITVIQGVKQAWIQLR